MFSSLSLFNSTNLKQLEGKSYEEIIKLFQSTKNEKIRNKCFRYIFCDLFPMLINVFNKYKIPAEIEIEEKVDLCILRVLSSMETYKENHISKAKFTSYVYGNVARGIMTLESSYKTNKRCTLLNTVNTVEQKKLDYILETNNSITYDDDIDNFIRELDTCILNSDEIDYCKKLLLGYKKPDELCKQLEVSTRFKNTKLMTKPRKDNENKEINERAILNKLKNSVKNKIKENGYSLW